MKFYSISRGKNTWGQAQIPWGFIQPPDNKAADVHFTMFALHNIPEEAICADLVVEYTVIPGTNMSASIDMFTIPVRNSSATVLSLVLSPYRENLINYRELETPIPIGTAQDRAFLYLRGIGDLQARLEGELRIFRNIFYTPGAASTLLSVRMLTKHGGW